MTLIIEKLVKIQNNRQASQQDQTFLADSKKRIMQFCDKQLNNICQYIDNG